MSALKAGDTVRVKDPDGFLADFAKKVTDRDAIVQWIGPDANGSFKGCVGVKFLKRNGRGKEFTEIFRAPDLVAAPAP